MNDVSKLREAVALMLQASVGCREVEPAVPDVDVKSWCKLSASSR